MTNNIARIGVGAFASCDSLSEVRYNGTKENWGAISVGSDNDKLINATVYCSDGIINCKHKYDAGKVTKAATCSVAGVKTYTCSVCKGTKTETISAKGHSYDAGKVTKQATCSVAGVKTYTCSVCKGIKTETIKALAHKAVTDEAVAATCTKTGLTEGSHCSECNATITAQEIVPIKQHNYKTTTTKATTKKNGTVVKKCSVCGASTKTTVYYPKTITLSKTSYTYNGKAQKPTVTVKDSKGKKIASSNYTLKYASNKNVGKATVTITFKGNYSGTVKKTFTINPKPTTLSSITAKSKGFTAKWKKLTTQTTGYEIQYSTSSKFSGAKTVTVSKNKTTSKTISKLKSKKKYYVRIRTYKTVKVNGKSTKIYSSWSKSKSVTTKK
ncbi:MAG: fibronectin type III domain-containing protein [Eubacterium sp.]|nr:fibronectin type III domain-containing protein [Eubacterium sp.]